MVRYPGGWMWKAAGKEKMKFNWKGSRAKLCLSLSWIIFILKRGSD